MDPSLLLTIGVIFMVTLVGSALRALRKDRCLRDFDGFHVTVERQDGRVMWGVMHLEPTAIELEYRDDVLDEQMHVETSYVLYKDEYPTIHAIYRYTDDLTPDNRKKRDRSCRRTFHPSPLYYMARRLRNFVNTATDSLTEAFNLLLGRAKPPAGQTVMPAGQTRLKGLTKDIVGHVGTNYDPLLERYIGSQTVIEVIHGDAVHEYVGVLKDYSASFLEILDVCFVRAIELALEPKSTSTGDGAATGKPTSTEAQRGGIVARIDDGDLLVQNETSHPILLTAIRMDDEDDTMNTIIGRGEPWRHPLSHAPERLGVTVRVIHQLDMILPRNRALIRHRAERYEPSDAFGLPLALDLVRRNAKKEGRSGQRGRLQAGSGETSRDFEILLLQRDHIPETDKGLARALQAREELSNEGTDSTPQEVGREGEQPSSEEPGR